MTTATHPRVDLIRLTIGGDQINLTPSSDIQLCLVVEPIPDGRTYGLLDPPRPDRLQVCVDLIPGHGPNGLSAEAVARCESMAAQFAAQLGADAPPLAPLKEFSLEATFVGEGVPYDRVSIPRLTLKPSGLPLLDEDQPEPAVRVFTATAWPCADGSKYVLTRKA